MNRIERATEDADQHHPCGGGGGAESRGAGATVSAGASPAGQARSEPGASGWKRRR